MRRNLSMLMDETALIPINIPIFDQNLAFIYGNNYNLIKEWVEGDIKDNPDIKNPDTLRKIIKGIRKDHDRHEGCHVKRKNWHIIYVKEQKTIRDFLKVTLHEVYHATQEVLSHIGVTPTESSEEVYAYLSEYIMNEIMKEMLSDPQEDFKQFASQLESIVEAREILNRDVLVKDNSLIREKEYPNYEV